jgi:hypothetical protein
MSNQTFDLQWAIKNLPVGQRRTGRQKQFVFLYDDIVVKGPYQPNYTKLTNLVNRSKILKQINADFFIHPIRVIDGNNNTRFVVFDNLAKNYAHKTELNQESFSSYSYNIIERNTLIKLNDCLLDYEWIRPLLPHLTLSLLYLYCLNTGDVGLSNILVDTQINKIYIIDYEENRGSDNTNELFYFSRNPAKNKRIFWKQYVSPFYGWLVYRLNQFKTNDDIINTNINKAIRLIQSFTQYRVYSPIRLQIQTKSKMSLGGLFNGTYGHSGYPLDEMKSAMQKYIRRQKSQKAFIAAIEMYRLSEINEIKARPIISNLYNRLAIIAAEDIGPANFNLAIEVIDLVNCKNRNVNMLLGSILALCQSNKTRIMSHLWLIYHLDVKRNLSEQMGIQSTEPAIEDVFYLRDFWNQIDDVNIRSMIEMFALRLSEQNHLAIYWWGQYYDYIQTSLKNKKKITIKTRHGRRKPDVLIWSILKSYLNEHDWKVLFTAYFTINENRPFIMMALTYILYGQVTEESTKTLLQYANLTKQNDIASTLLSGKYNWTIDDYCIDMHTSRGRKMGKNRTDFVLNGAKVTPLSKHYYDSKYEQIYNA